MSLTHDDVERIIRLLDNSHFDELTLEMDGVKLELRRHGASGPASARILPQGTLQGARQDVQADAPTPPPAPIVTPTGLHDVRAPMLGTFYRAPKPGAEPFVQVGMQVEPNDPVGIIEVMKLMNSISTGLSGKVVEMLARDGEMVEYDQVLMRVRPA